MSGNYSCPETTSFLRPIKHDLHFNSHQFTKICQVAISTETHSSLSPAAGCNIPILANDLISVHKRHISRGAINFAKISHFKPEEWTINVEFGNGRLNWPSFITIKGNVDPPTHHEICLFLLLKEDCYNYTLGIIACFSG